MTETSNVPWGVMLAVGRAGGPGRRVGWVSEPQRRLHWRQPPRRLIPTDVDVRVSEQLLVDAAGVSLAGLHLVTLASELVEGHPERAADLQAALWSVSEPAPVGTLARRAHVGRVEAGYRTILRLLATWRVAVSL